MGRAAAILLAVSLLATGCSSNSPAKSKPAATDVATPDVLEAVFRFQLDQNATASRYCLELAGTSPAPEFLHRFEGHQPPVLSADQCKSQPSPSLYLRLTKIQWIIDTEARVRGSVSDGNPNSPIVAYRAVREKGKWTVSAVETGSDRRHPAKE